MFQYLVIILKVILFFNFAIANVFAQEFQFQREINTIPVNINGVPIQSPFAGGFSFSRPAFVDIDDDGDFDLFVGEEEGHICFYRNTGTPKNFTFTFVEREFLLIDVGTLSSPTFVDIDKDKDFDLFVGERSGVIKFYRNSGTITNPIYMLETSNVGSIDVGDRSNPTFIDIDNDGDSDLFVGEENGNINFYRNTSTTIDITFTYEEEVFASIDVGVYSTPTFIDIDNDGDFDLFVGESDGNINFYRNTGTATNPSFSLVTEVFASINVGTRSSPNFTDLDNDGDFDLFVGESDGNMNFYRNIGTKENPSFILETENCVSIDIGSRGAPAFFDIDNDGDLDLILGEWDGNLNLYVNTGSFSNPAFTFATENFASINVGNRSSPTFADIDADGHLDLFIGEHYGNINYYQNTGTAVNPDFAFLSSSFAYTSSIGSSSIPAFADIDGDEDLDLFVGEWDGNINFFRNTGTATEPTYNLETENFSFINVGNLSAPNLLDIDNDSDFDLLIGDVDGNINFYRNTGTIANPAFTPITGNFALIDVGSSSSPTFVDIDNDMDFDLFVGEIGGGLYFYRNVTPTNVLSQDLNVIPKSFNLSQNYPNPFNSDTIIKYNIPEKTYVKLIVYNLLGTQLRTLVDKEKVAGSFQVSWDGKNDNGKQISTGIYIYQLQTDRFTNTNKLTILR